MDDIRAEVEALAARRWRLAGVLTVVLFTSYFGFVLLAAFNKPLMGHVVTRGLSVGIVLGALVIVTAWLLTGIYVNWANKTYDAAIADLRNRMGGAK